MSPRCRSGNSQYSQCFHLHFITVHRHVSLSHVFFFKIPVVTLKSPCIVNYYLSLLTNVEVDHARERLTLMSVYDTSTEPLCAKLLKRPRMLQRIQNLVEDPSQTMMSTYCLTDLERTLADHLGVMYPATSWTHPSTFWGSKIGSRIIFQNVNIPHCLGVYESLDSIPKIVSSIIALRKEHPDVRKFYVKLNEGASGLGNALWSAPKGIHELDPVAIQKSLIHDLEPCWNEKTAQEFLANVPTFGAIVEECIMAKELRSPSAQGMIHGDGFVQVISTHEQILHHGIYDGCTFPADAAYRESLQEYCERVGHFLASRGVRNEHFGVDFVAYYDKLEEEWKLLAIEINMRCLGTTHPMETLKLLMPEFRLTSNGRFCHAQEDSTTSSNSSRSRCYFAEDNFQHESLTKLTPEDLMEIIDATSELQYDKETSTGTIFYMMDALASYGKVGIMCIQETVDLALTHVAKVRSILLQINHDDSIKDKKHTIYIIMTVVGSTLVKM